MPFSFDFSGDDIDESGCRDARHTNDSQQPSSRRSDSPAIGTKEGTSDTLSRPRQPPAPSVETDGTFAQSKSRIPKGPTVQKHLIKTMLSSLPDRIAYTTTLVTSPQRGRKALIPRRALFDVRLQIMAESETSPILTEAATGSDSSSRACALDIHMSGDKNPLTSGHRTSGFEEGQQFGLGDADIEKDVYEGGFKSWEGALDLARLVLERGPRKDLDELARVNAVVELGCGTALPTLVLFQHALATGLSLYFTLADYNESVLRLVTVPNLLLVWALEHSPESFSPSAPFLSRSDASSIQHADGDLDVTPELIQHFMNSLAERSIDVLLLSGPWSPKLMKHLPLHPDMSLLCLAAETIYSPSSLDSFTETLLGILRSVRMGKGMVAAKRVYFGVGGSVDEFKIRVSEGGGVAYEVENSGIEGTEKAFMGGTNSAGVSGVGRCLMEVQMC